MDGTIIQQGNFVSTGANTTLQIRSDVDWIRVYNYTAAAGAVQFAVPESYWQRGFAVNDGIINFHAAASQVISMSTSAAGVNGPAVDGFTLVNSSVNTLGPAVAFTAISTDPVPRVTTGSTATLRTGDKVLLTNIAGAPQFGGYGFTVTVIDATHFDLTNAPTLIVAGTTGFWRKIPNPPLFYPVRRRITAITSANPAVVTTAEDHGYTVGQEVRFSIPSAFGMIQLDNQFSFSTGNQFATITAVTAHTFTINVDTTGFTAFTFPLAAAVPFTPAEVVPFGENTAQALLSGVDPLGDSTINIGYLGIILAGGISSPAGQAGNVIYWVAGKSFNV